MMKMDDRDSAECQKWEKRDITVIFGKVFKSLDDKTATVSSLASLKRPKTRFNQNFSPVAIFFEFFL